MEDAILMTAHLTDNVAVDWMKTVVQSYVNTMKLLVRNTFTELYPESWSPGSSAAAMTSREMVVLATAYSSLCGLLVSLAVLYTICKVVCWICVAQPTNGRSECLRVTSIVRREAVIKESVFLTE